MTRDDTDARVRAEFVRWVEDWRRRKDLVAVEGLGKARSVAGICCEREREEP